MFFNALTLPWDLAIFVFLAVSFSGCLLSAKWLHRHPQVSALQKSAMLCLGALSGFAFMLVFYGSFIEPQIITVTQLAAPFPTEQPLRIAIISDTHVGPYKGASFLRRVVQKMNALKPDLVLIVGDMTLSEEITADALAALQPLEDLQSKLGTYAILGNHDHSIYRLGSSTAIRPPDRSDRVFERMTSLGIRVLRNDAEVVETAEDRIVIAGIDDAFSGEADIVKALRNRGTAMPTILLSHNPDVILDPASRQAHLIVAGHTHGGQIRLPWIGPVASLPTHLGKKFDQGVFNIGSGSTLAITRGVGESGPRARLFAPPEILLLTTTSE